MAGLDFLSSRPAALWIKLSWIIVIVLSLSHGATNTSTEEQKSQAYKEISEINFNMKPEGLVIPDMRSDDQDSVDSRLWGGVNLKREASSIANKLRELANKELGVTSLQVSNLNLSKGLGYIGSIQKHCTLNSIFHQLTSDSIFHHGNTTSWVSNLKVNAGTLVTM